MAQETAQKRHLTPEIIRQIEENLDPNTDVEVRVSGNVISVFVIKRKVRGKYQVATV